jgi:hypothetical protein
MCEFRDPFRGFSAESALSGDPFPLNLLQQITGTPYSSNCSSVVTTVKSCS